MHSRIARWLGLAAAAIALSQPVHAYQFVRAANPARTIVNDDTGQWRATYTDGAYTVRHWGAARTFAEAANPGVTLGGSTVTHTSYVRVMPLPWPAGASPSEADVDALLARTDADVLAVAMQYVFAQPDVKVADPNALTGFRWISGDAGYGGTIGADFNDFMGIDWDYGSAWGGIDTREDNQYGQLDCSGFVRMVYGLRSGIPLAKSGHERPGIAIPRTSALQEDPAHSVGVTIVTKGAAKPADLGNLSPGDLVFFDSTGPDGVIDHVGIYLGVDNAGRDRVLSSRNSLRGPTMLDAASGSSPSTLQGSGWMPDGFRAARRF